MNEAVNNDTRNSTNMSATRDMHDDANLGHLVHHPLPRTRPQPLERVAITPATLAVIREMAEVATKSGLFKCNASQAMVKMLMGAEIGLGFMESVIGIHVIDGAPAISAGVMAQKIRASGLYDYKILESNYERCRVEYYRLHYGGVELLGEIVTTFAEYEASGLVHTKDAKGNQVVKRNWRVHADDMLFARNISKGKRRYCPDVFGGARVYTHEEFDDLAAGEQQYDHTPGLLAAPAEATSAEAVPESVPEPPETAAEATPESKTTSKTTSEVVDTGDWEPKYDKNGLMTTECVDHIHSLIDPKPGTADWAAVVKWLNAEYGVENFRRLSRDQAIDCRRRLLHFRAKKQQST